MAKRIAVKAPWWAPWPATVAVEVQKVPAQGFASTTYVVFVDDEPVGFVASQRAQGRATLWGGYTDTTDRFLASTPSRVHAVEALVSAHLRGRA